MWIEKKKNSKGKTVYKYIERYFDPKVNDYRKVSVTMMNKARDTQKEAEKNLNKKIDDRLDTKKIVKPELTFHKLVEEWMPIYKHQVKESTYFPTKNILNTIKKKIPSNHVLSGISTTDLNNLFEELLYKDNLSNKYVSVIKAKISLIFAYAEKKNYVLNNPMNSVTIDYKREGKTSKIKDKFLEDDEYTRLIDYTMKHNKRYGLLFQWLYLTGMRPGEATALQKEDILISEKESFATINGTLMYRERSVKDMKKSDSTKTAAGMREVDLPKKAVEIYNTLLEMNQNGDFLFQTSNGTPILITAINTYLRNHKDKMAIEKNLSSHIFRHTHISKLAELGTPLYAIQDRVGHENSDITEKIYLHVTKGVKQRLKEDIEKL